MPRLAPLLSPFLALAIGAATLPICQTAAGAQPSATEKKAIDEASELYKQGRTKFEMAEYADAISLWKEAYAKLPDADESRAIKNDLVYNISEAQVRAYEIDRDATHLRKARVLLVDYLRNHEALYGTDTDAIQERSAAKDRLAEVDQMLESAPEPGPAPVGDGAASTEDGHEAATPKELSPDQKRAQEQRAAQAARLAEIESDPELHKQDQANRKRIVTGAVLGGVGLTLVVGAYFSLSYYGTTLGTTPDPTGLDPVDSNPSTGALVAGLVLGVAGLGLLGAGAGLLGTGMKARKQLRTPTTSAQAFVSPWAGRHSGGASVLVRF